ncbi:hypothetical protein IFO25_09990, partial [Campylobacter coli]|nr:hypothetical protein [Campylobacter coli]
MQIDASTKTQSFSIGLLQQKMWQNNLEPCLIVWGSKMQIDASTKTQSFSIGLLQQKMWQNNLEPCLIV